jgi:hypothetical protein
LTGAIQTLRRDLVEILVIGSLPWPVRLISARWSIGAPRRLSFWLRRESPVDELRRLQVVDRRATLPKPGTGGQTLYVTQQTST